MIRTAITWIFCGVAVIAALLATMQPVLGSFAFFRRGDPLAREVWDAAMADLGAGIATVINLFNPDVVVLGGGVSRSADLLLPTVRRVVRERAMPMHATAVRIEA